MKKFEDFTYDEQKEIRELFANWLKGYTEEVIYRVMERAEEIINNEFAMNLLKELKQREEEEQKDFTNSIECLITSFDSFKEYNPHNHPLTHADSYRDILYDMFIR
jgi:hypothetical protein